MYQRALLQRSLPIPSLVTTYPEWPRECAGTRLAAATSRAGTVNKGTSTIISNWFSSATSAPSSTRASTVSRPGPTARQQPSTASRAPAQAVDASNTVRGTAMRRQQLLQSQQVGKALAQYWHFQMCFRNNYCCCVPRNCAAWPTCIHLFTNTVIPVGSHATFSTGWKPHCRCRGGTLGLLHLSCHIC
jgi:hypothetical protein